MSSDLHLILASTCGHRLRYSKDLPWDDTALDFDQPYCGTCVATHTTKVTDLHLVLASECGHPLRFSDDDDTELDLDQPLCKSCVATQQAESEYEDAVKVHRYVCKLESNTGSLCWASRQRLCRAKVALLRDQAKHASSDDLSNGKLAEQYGGDLPTPPATDVGSPTTSPSESDSQLPERPSLERKRSVHFEVSPDIPYRPEVYYRPNWTFHRDSKEYEPGRWADRSGLGFEHTSGPTGLEEERKEEEKENEDVKMTDEEYQEYLSELSDEALAELEAQEMEKEMEEKLLESLAGFQGAEQVGGEEK